MSSEGQPTETSGSTSEMDSLRAMMQMLIEDRQKREAEIAEERQMQKEAMAEERRVREAQYNEERSLLMEQMGRLQKMVESKAAPPPGETTDGRPTLKLNRLHDTDDIEVYLITFERSMEAYEIDTKRWSFLLAPHLTGKAQQAYAAMAADSARDYEQLKVAILRRYNINEETYRQRFRARKLRSGEPPQEFITRLHDLASRWTRECKTAAAVVDLLVREQFLSGLPEEVRVHVKERSPNTSKEAAELAEGYLQAHPQTSPCKFTSKNDKAPPGKCPRCGELGHWARECPKSKQQDSTGTKPPAVVKREPICFSCQQRGHIASKCPSNPNWFCEDSTNICKLATSPHENIIRLGRVEGKLVPNMIVDTGASRTLVRSDLLSPSTKLQGQVTIRCAHGDNVTYPLADVKISTGPREFTVRAAVSDNLPVPALLGRDIPELVSLIKDEPKETGDALLVTTRAQKKRLQEEEQAFQEKEKESGVMPKPLIDEAQIEPPFEFDDSLFVPGKSKERLSRSRKRQERLAHICNTKSHPLDIPAHELQLLQETDPSLEDARRIADGEPALTGHKFCRQDGLLYRQYTPPMKSDNPTVVEQLVLPNQCRQEVLKLAHSIPLAGHLGKQKTAQRILQRFYWPSLYKDVANYCKSCPECQKASPKGSHRAPMVSLPVMGEPFQRIAMDIVGPLPRS